MSNNQPSRTSRWGNKEDPRDRSHSLNDRGPPPPDRHPEHHQRGYDTSGGPPQFSRDRDRDRDRREDYRDYDRGGRRDSREFHDWRCMECGLFNDPRDERCPRCGEWKPRERGRDDRDRGRDGKGREDDYYGPPGREDDDYRDGRRSKKSRKEPKKPEWPPAFEAGGAAYIFDARSGMFYEPASDFFYDPKTKMYYSNKKQKYFQFVKGMDPEFQAIESQQPGGGAGSVAVVTTANANDVANGNGSEKPKIEISLKTAVTPSEPASKAQVSAAASERSKLIEKLRKASSAPTANKATTDAVPQVHKKHAKDMDVWSGRIKEMKGEEPDAAANNPPEPAPVKMTQSGQPICTLCRRKFANLEKLRQHEKLSDLHKTNLEKKAAADAQAAKQKESATTETTYRDRTKERQMMYSASSTDTSHVDKLLASVNPVGGVEKATEVIRPEQTLGDGNVGNQLLQKMGWKNGENLGRKQEGVNGAEAVAGENVASKLKNDWERIESMAQAGGVGRR